MKCYFLLVNLLFTLSFSICAQQFDGIAITDLRVATIMENDTFKQNMEGCLTAFGSLNEYVENLNATDRIVYQQKTKEYYAALDELRKSVMNGDKEVLSMHEAQKNIQQDFPELAIKFKVNTAQRKVLSIEGISQLKEEIIELSNLSLREVAVLVKEAVDQYLQEQ